MYVSLLVVVVVMSVEAKYILHGAMNVKNLASLVAAQALHMQTRRVSHTYSIFRLTIE